MDVTILQTIHQIDTPWLTQLMTFLTLFGKPEILLPIGILLAAYAYSRKGIISAAIVTLSLAGAGLLTSILKEVFERARPELWPREIMESSFSFPSGHASTTMVVALICCYLVWQHKRFRLTAVVLSLLYVGSISFTRLYLGVHYPTDILGGWLLAIVWFALVLTIVPRIAKAFDD